MGIRKISAVAATGAIILAVRAAVRLAPGPLLRWCSSNRATHAQLPSDMTINVSRVAWAVDRAGSYLSATCLERAITLVTLVRLRYWTQTDARLVIGAQSDPAFRAHAWVESGGALFGGLDEPYASLLPVRHHR